MNPATGKIYVTHYGTGDVRAISGAFDPSNDFPASTSIPVFSHPYAIAANPVTNRIYVITQDSRGPIAVIDGSNDTAAFPTLATGHGQQPQALAVNPVTNKVYAAFQSEVIVIDGSTNALTYIPIADASSGAIAIGIDYSTNRVLVATALGSLTVIDGDTDTIVATDAVPGGTSSVGVNPVTSTAYFFDSTLATRAAGGGPHAIPLSTTITPYPGDTSSASGTITLSAGSGFAPAALAVRAVYYQLDSTVGAWSAAAGSGPYTATFSDLAPGPHTIYAFAVDGQDATLATGPQSAPLIGSIAS